MKRRKFGNKPTTIDGRRFDSKKEAKRYCELKLLEASGQIRLLECQPRFAIEIDGHKITTYVADFAYVDTKAGRVIEDVKGGSATKTPVYRLKKKLVEAVYGIEIREV